jgi:hypothetical protein
MEKNRKTAAKVTPLKAGKSYSSVSEMVHRSLDADSAAAFDAHVAARGLINSLVVLRGIKGVNQAELASRMKCSQPKVSKVEASADADLCFGDVVSYASALDMSMHIALTPANANGADHIRFHLGCIKHELDQLVAIAGEDPTIGRGVETFAVQTTRNMLAVIEQSIDQLPHRSAERPAVCVEAGGERGGRLSLDPAPPKRVRKTRDQPATPKAVPAAIVGRALLLSGLPEEDE